MIPFHLTFSMYKFQFVADIESDFKNKASIQLFSQFELHYEKKCSVLNHG